MTRISPRRPQGFYELLPPQQVQLQAMLDTIRRVYERYGFLPIETPAVELAEVLLAKGGGETEQEVFRFSKGDKEYALHYDLTVPLARYVAEHESELVFPFKRYQMQKVWRAERPQKGRYREFYQCDADIIGSNSVGHDAELLALICDVFGELSLGDFVVTINNRKLLSGLLEAIGLEAQSLQIFAAIDKLEKIGASEVTQLLKAAGCGDDDSAQILDFVNISGSTPEMIDKLEGLSIENKTFQNGLGEVKALFKNVMDMGVDDKNYVLDLRIVRGLDYYTGTVYETKLLNYPDFGSVCSGGRYDNLAEYYTKTHLPGVGVSIGLTRLFAALAENDALQVRPSNLRVYVASIDSSSQPWASTVGATLRRADIVTRVDIEGSKIDKQFKTADKLGAAYVIVVGEQEVAEQSVVLKNMQSGEQKSMSLGTAVEYLQSDLA